MKVATNVQLAQMSYEHFSNHIFEIFISTKFLFVVDVHFNKKYSTLSTFQTFTIDVKCPVEEGGRGRRGEGRGRRKGREEWSKEGRGKRSKEGEGGVVEGGKGRKVERRGRGRFKDQGRWIVLCVLNKYPKRVNKCMMKQMILEACSECLRLVSHEEDSMDFLYKHVDLHC